ncbi:cyclin a2 [Raphanus sativus]|nr:cyclin a2 [Raphanus sativus]
MHKKANASDDIKDCCQHKRRSVLKDASKRDQDVDAEKSKLAEDLSKIRMVESATNSKDGDQLDQRPSTSYMVQVREISVQACVGFSLIGLWRVQLASDTLYLAVNLLIGSCPTITLKKRRLQLLGVTCMLIASKYEEICAPRLGRVLLHYRHTYTRLDSGGHGDSSFKLSALSFISSNHQNVSQAVHSSSSSV